MDSNEYQRLTELTEIYTDAAKDFLSKHLYEVDAGESVDDKVRMLSAMYCAGKLNGEAGEVAELVFKAFREGEFTPDKMQKLFYELGDVQWYIARLAGIFGWNLEGIMQANIDKLIDRKDRGVIHGYGDER